MKQFKPLIRLLLLFLVVTPAFSQSGTTETTDEAPAIDFVVWTHSGEKIAYSLTEHPVVTYSSDKLTLTTRTGAVEYASGDVWKFTFAPIYYFVAWLTDGSRYAYALSEHPVVTYSGGELQLSTQAQQIAYDATDVRKFTFSTTDITFENQQPPATGISTPKEPLFGMQDGEIHISGIRPGSPINIYTLDGKLLHTEATDANGTAHLSITPYPAGVYIIKTETITHKIIKR